MVFFDIAAEVVTEMYCFVMGLLVKLGLEMLWVGGIAILIIERPCQSAPIPFLGKNTLLRYDLPS